MELVNGNAVVSHKTPRKAMIDEVLGMDIMDIAEYCNCRQVLACINISNISETLPVIEKMNDTCHLQGIDD